MKLFNFVLAVAMVSILAGCASTPIGQQTPAQQQQQLVNTRTQQYQECLVYHGLQPTIAKKVATLPIKQATALYDASVQATKYCGTVLTNSQSEIKLLAQAFTTITLEAGVSFALPTPAAPTQGGVK